MKYRGNTRIDIENPVTFNLVKELIFYFRLSKQQPHQISVNFSCPINHRRPDQLPLIIYKPGIRLQQFNQVFVKAHFHILPYQELTTEAYARLSYLVQDVFIKVQAQFMLTEYAQRMKTGLVEDERRDSFIAHAQMHWCNVRGKRYQVHEIPLLKLLLSPQSELLVRNLGVSAEKIIDNLDKILKSLTSGPFDSGKDFLKFQKKTMEEVDRLTDTDPTFSQLEPQE